MCDSETIARRLLKGILLQTTAEKLCFLVEALARRQPSLYKGKSFDEMYDALKTQALQLIPYFKDDILLMYDGGGFLQGRFAAEFKCTQDQKILKKFVWKQTPELEDYLSDDVNGLSLKLFHLNKYIRRYGEAIRHVEWGKYMAADTYWQIKFKEKRLEKHLGLPRDEENTWGFTDRDLYQENEKEMLEFEHLTRQKPSFILGITPNDSDTASEGSE